MLENLVLPSRAGLVCEYSGMDSPDHCRDRQHFDNYAVPVSYCYNSRGFRDREWCDDLASVIWCIGDSFTVGIGSPLEHTWPYILQQNSGRRVINISLDGASNSWICRTAQQILNEFPQARIVLHWSYIHRRELSVQDALIKKWKIFYQNVKDHDWPDCNYQDRHCLPESIQSEIQHCHGWQDLVYDDDRINQYINCSLQQDVINTEQCMQAMPAQVIQSCIPRWCPAVCTIDHPGLIHTPQLDRARDGHHYDILTAQWLVSRITSTAQWHATW